MDDEIQMVKATKGPDWLEGVSWQYGSVILKEMGLSASIYDSLSPVCSERTYGKEHTYVRLKLHLNRKAEEKCQADPFNPFVGVVHKAEFDWHDSSPLLTFAISQLDGWPWYYYVSRRQPKDIYIECLIEGQLQHFDVYVQSVIARLREVNDLWNACEKLSAALKGRPGIFQRLCGLKAEVKVVRGRQCPEFSSSYLYHDGSSLTSGKGKDQAVEMLVGRGKSHDFPTYIQPSQRGFVFDILYRSRWSRSYSLLTSGRAGTVEKLVRKVASTIVAESERNADSGDRALLPIVVKIRSCDIR